MNAAAFLAEATLVANEHHDLPSKWFFGGFALVALLALLFIVTRVNIDR
jgi:bacteriorhodopsin